MNSRRLAEEDFERAYRRGFWRKLGSWLTGQSNELLPFDAVRERIPIRGQHYLGLQQVRIEQIVGSLGRYRDFDRAFLPRQDRTRGRWVSIDSAHYEDTILPPVDLFKVGEIYFVRDGNHRVSVARERGQEFMDAFVIEIDVPVSMTTELELDDLELKADLANFLEQTRIDKIRPGSQIELTLPGEYERLLEHINVHRWYLGENRGSEVPFEDAVASWFDTVYTPMVDLIDEHQLLADFPDRTPADLYLWIIEYEWFLREAYRNDYSFQVVSNQFKERFTGSPSRRLVNILKSSVWVDNLILDGERKEFQSLSNLQNTRPEAGIEVTVPGQYSQLLEHIEVHRYYLNEGQEQEIAFEDAAASWYDRVYTPLAQFIRDQDILAYFPGRTEADLYLWILEQQASIRDVFGQDISLEEAIEYLRGKK
jgi:hypothetical protein